MRVVVVGAGPIGLFSAMVLARLGQDVTVVDRDPGPAADGSWARRGVMQFHHPHAFRPQVRQALAAHLPDVLDAVVAEGALPVPLPFGPPGATMLQSRRSTLERALRRSVEREPGLRFRVGHVDRVTRSRGRATGLIVDGARVHADAVVWAGGRASRLEGDGRAPAEGGDCGFAYVSRMYRARPGVKVPHTGVPMTQLFPGYQAMLFPQDADTVCALVVRRSEDLALAELRHTPCFDAATAAIPLLAPWTAPEQFVPLTPPKPGVALHNSYRGQLDADGQVPLPGLIFVGDAVSTTNPAAGRGVALGLQQAQALVGMFAETTDLEEVALRFDNWCARQVRPWFADHVYWDQTLRVRFTGQDLNLDARIPSDVICAAAEVAPAIATAAAAYFAMLAPPDSLAPFEETARQVLRTGWRPPVANGPSRSELAELVTRAKQTAPDASPQPRPNATKTCVPGLSKVGSPR